LTPPAAPAAISPDNYAWLQQHIYRHSGIVIDANKHYLLDARLLPIVRQENLRGLNDLCALLRATETGPLAHAVRDAMTTNETLFFRDAIPFRALQDTLIPEMLAAQPIVPRLRFWSAASSSGQEGYSLAMMLLDMGLDSFSFDILATDISDIMLERGAAGLFSQLEVSRGLPAQQLVKYFQRVGADWQIRDEVRRKVRFQPFDLRDPAKALGPFDCILCRNVLIYFDIATRKRILEQLFEALRPGGYLLLGAAETTLNLTDCFERRALGAASFYRKR
jgi:chemotaxis protein methyltransferase CheR